MKNLFTKMLCALTVSIFISFSFTYAQPQVVWQKSYGGTLNDGAQSIDKTSDGGYIVAGESLSNDADVTQALGSSDFWITRLNGDGDIIWQRSFGGNSTESAQVIRQTATGEFIVTGPVSSKVPGKHSGKDYWVLKLDGNGNTLWEKCFGGSDSDTPYAMDLCHDGGYVIAGKTFSCDGDVTGDHPSGDYWIIKLDSEGTLQWQKSYGGSALDFAHAVVSAGDGGYLVSGYARSGDGDVGFNYGEEDMWILKLDENGDLVWKKYYGGTRGEGASSAVQTSDGGYILTGTTHSHDIDVVGSHGDHEFWVVKINSTGDLQWTKCLGGSETDNGNSIRQTSDGGYIVAGLSDSNDDEVSGNHGKHDFSVVKLNNEGAIEWQKSLGGSADDQAFEIVPAVDGSFVVAGQSASNDGNVSGHHGDTTSNDFWLVKLSACTVPSSAITANGSDTICAGESVMLTEISGADSFQWKLNNADISGATNSSYAASQGGDYSCHASNSCGNGISNTISITVKSPPSNSDALITASGPTAFCSGSNFSLMVATAGLNYQWFKNEKLIAEATSQTYSPTKSETYSCNVSNGCGTVTSNSIAITKISAPSATITPLGNLDLCLTRSVVLQGNNEESFSYQWMKGGDTIASATNESYTATAKGTYKLIVTNSTGCSKKSSGVKLTNSCKVEESTATAFPTFSTYPNPSNGKFNIALSLKDAINEDVVVEVTNSLGQQIFKKLAMIRDGVLKEEIDLTKINSPGLYFILVNAGEKQFRSQLILQH